MSNQGDLTKRVNKAYGRKVCVAPAIDLSRKKKKKRLNFNQKRIENKGKTNLNVMEKMFKYGGPSAEV